MSDMWRAGSNNNTIKKRGLDGEGGGWGSQSVPEGGCWFVEANTEMLDMFQ